MLFLSLERPYYSDLNPHFIRHGYLRPRQVTSSIPLASPGFLLIVLLDLICFWLENVLDVFVVPWRRASAKARICRNLDGMVSARRACIINHACCRGACCVARRWLKSLQTRKPRSGYSNSRRKNLEHWRILLYSGERIFLLSYYWTERKWIIQKKRQIERVKESEELCKSSRGQRLSMAKLTGKHRKWIQSTLEPFSREMNLLKTSSIDILFY